MYIVLAIIIVIIGFMMILKPKLIYDITQGWKNYADSEPSDLYILSTRLGGFFFVLVGIAGVIVLLVF